MSSPQDDGSIFNAMPDALAVHEWITDSRGKPCDYRIITVNPAFRRLIKLAEQDSADVPGRSLRTIIAPWVLGLAETGSATSDPVRLDTYFPTLDKHMRLTVFSLNKARFAVHFLDISEDIQCRRKTEPDADQPGLTQCEFFAHLSHEIRTPIHTLLSFLEHLAHSSPKFRGSPILHAIQASSHNVLTTLNDIITLSRAHSVKVESKPEPTSLQDLVKDIQTMYSLKIAQKKLQFDLEVDPDLPDELFLDRFRLRQILVNLVDNAVKFTQKGFVRLNFTPAIDRGFAVKVTVEDSGDGIAPQNLSKIFEPFERAGAQRPVGAGLGLAICRQLAADIGARLQVYSTPGRGTRFELDFPNAHEPETGSPCPAFNHARRLEQPTRHRLLPTRLTANSLQLVHRHQPASLPGRPMLGCRRSCPHELTLRLIHVYRTMRGANGRRSTPTKHPLIRQVETQCLPLWEQFDRLQPIPKVRQFAQLIKGLGERHQFPMLCSYGAALQSAVNRFDIRTMRTLLAEFPDRLNDLEVIASDD